MQIIEHSEHSFQHVDFHSAAKISPRPGHSRGSTAMRTNTLSHWWRGQIRPGPRFCFFEWRRHNGRICRKGIDWTCGKLRIYNNLQSLCRCLVCHISRCFAEQDDLLEFVGRLDNQVGDKSAGWDADLIMVCSWFEECMMFNYMHVYATSPF